MKIDKHISSLLYEHDCVIVPDFGGFVTSYAPAKVQATQHVFRPPHKNITFNKHLKSNDGLLANQIVLAENKTFTEANSIINSFVTECNGTLKRGDKVTIEQVGAVYLDVERNIQFEPDKSVNYLVDAFGMGSIQSLPVKRETIERRIEKQFVDRDPVPQDKKRRKAFATIVTTIVLVIATSLIWLSVQTNILKGTTFSSLNPFAERVKPLYTGRSDIKPALTEKDFNSEKLALPTNDTIPVTAIAFVNDVDHKLVVRLHENVLPASPQRDKTAVSNNAIRSTQGLKYHVVSGCFKIESNARNFVAMMKAKNLNAAIIGKNKDGLYIVSCGDYSNEEEAYKELARVRVTTQAWMLAQ
jgi:hypothetical protein